MTPPTADNGTESTGGIPGCVVRVDDPRAGSGDPFVDQLTDFLLFLVPLMLAEMRGWSAQRRAIVAADTASLIASHGDDAQYGGRHQGPARTAIARALALGASFPCGVTQFGVHACLHPHPGCPAGDR